MSTDYFLVCYTCQSEMPEAFATGSGFRGYKVWWPTRMQAWLGHGEAIGSHEGHDLRIVHEQADLPWNCEECGFRRAPRGDGEIHCYCDTPDTGGSE